MMAITITSSQCTKNFSLIKIPSLLLPLQHALLEQGCSYCSSYVQLCNRVNMALFLLIDSWDARQDMIALLAFDVVFLGSPFIIMLQKKSKQTNSRIFKARLGIKNSCEKQAG